MRNRSTVVWLSAVAVLFASACGTDEASDTGAPSTSAAAPEEVELETTPSDPIVDPPADDPPADETSEKPTDIDFPGEAPTELVITVLIEGEGPLAAEGDSVVVDYVGVRSLDGVEFDASYGRAPFSVSPLGSANVIQGWNDGLMGAQAGSRIQLDIPADLAYGTTARSEVIRENEPLTFVIDVRAVLTPSDPEAAPSEAGVDLSDGATGLIVDDLIVGDGAVLEVGQTAAFDLLLFRGDTGELLDSTWGLEPLRIPMVAGGFPALVDGMPGMAVGGRRALTFPPEFGFGPEGNPGIGLPAGADAIIVVDLYAAY